MKISKEEYAAAVRAANTPIPRGEAVCHLCGERKICSYLKTAHVPLYAWVCDDDRDAWTADDPTDVRET